MRSRSPSHAVTVNSLPWDHVRTAHKLSCWFVLLIKVAQVISKAVVQKLFKSNLLRILQYTLRKTSMAVAEFMRGFRLKVTVLYLGTWLFCIEEIERIKSYSNWFQIWNSMITFSYSASPLVSDLVIYTTYILVGFIFKNSFPQVSLKFDFFENLESQIMGWFPLLK